MASILRVLAALFLLALPVASAGPAKAAAAEDATLQPILGTITLAPGGPDKVTLLWVRSTAETLTEHTFTLTLDHSDVAAFAAVDFAIVGYDDESGMSGTAPSAAASGPCTSTDTTITCVWDGIYWDADSLAIVGLVAAEPKESAATGDEGTIVVRTQVDDGPVTTGESTVRVGEGVDLAAGENQEVSAVAGGTATANPVVRNAGSTDVTGVVMFVDANAELLGESSYSNCRYGDGTFACTFDDVLTAGSSYTVSDPIRLLPPADSIPGSQAEATVQWMTATEWSDLLEALPDGFLGDAGTGDPLTLDEVATGQDQPQSDVDPVNDAGTITMTVAGDEGGDLAAVGARVSAMGAGATISVGTRNAGSGTLRPDLYPNNRVAAVVRLPGNVTAVDVDPRCDTSSDGAYLCTGTAAVSEGERQVFDFTVRVDESRGAAGTVEVADIAAADTENNVARIVVTGSGGSGGGLPITGPGPLGTVAAGAAFVLLGALLAVRRIKRPVCAHAVRETGRGRRRKGHAR